MKRIQLKQVQVKQAKSKQARSKQTLASPLWNPFSLVNQVSLSMLVITVCAIIGMSVSAWVANSIQGNAHAINRIGFMRMQSFELLSLLPLNQQTSEVLSVTDKSSHSQFLEEYIHERGLSDEYKKVHRYWLEEVKPTLLEAHSPDGARQVITQYVDQLDQLVHLIDKETEHRLWVLKSLQTTFIILLLLILFANVVHLRSRIFHPWRQLLTMAFELKNGHLQSRFPVNNKKDELNQLGIMFNSMADKLESMYSNLETLVESKTESLTHKNRLLDFLYRSSGVLILDNSERYCALFSPIVFELRDITGYQNITLEIADYHKSGNCQVISTAQHQRPENCLDLSCEACFFSISEPLPNTNGEVKVWELEDGLRSYGRLKIEFLHDQAPSEDNLQFIDTLSKQITRSLASKYQEHLNSELMLANERATIARELHDSIAQSLSCLKIRLSCLQMQSSHFSDDQKNLVKEMRQEVDTAYTQLRHLLATFRLKLTEPGLLAALENTVEEFNEKLGLMIHLNFEVPANSISSHQAVHIVHIVREALSNIYKHANASMVHIDAKYDVNNQKVSVTVTDNGCGMNTITEPKNHYGLTIMRDRAKLLPGKLNIKSESGVGTRINIEFSPQ
ncbi:MULTISPECIES: nitrate/nitrite two-component system sensor histidine kinase NarX [Vibrio]|uniref:Sensor protein n=1 Tax=Vibrio casei TaxID=673372 RepID=A0A368LHG5_9VIBR|nr:MULTISPECIES: nitrate/nitrite two-component system sensor histidine kinase NarX [Vibrio]RCS70066.1 nitrate/nitrite two-component system sensor histidine kinase NarX [Vibrio casei]SJN34130.1 Nitrate/nitrite sensor protein [Vibrio casei]HBV76790.1 nitrate/nitrite two-component system sensor histidine kinase NarX [Vibrio sp.]